MSRGQRLSDSNTTNDPAATDDKFARHIQGCVHVIPQLKALLPSLPALIAEDALLQSVQVQQLVAQQQWFMVSSTVIRDALSLLKLGSKWDELASSSVLHRYGNVLHLVGRAWRRVAVQLAGTADSSGQVRKQTIRSGLLPVLAKSYSQLAGLLQHVQQVEASTGSGSSRSDSSTPTSTTSSDNSRPTNTCSSDIHASTSSGSNRVHTAGAISAADAAKADGVRFICVAVMLMLSTITGAMCGSDMLGGQQAATLPLWDPACSLVLAVMHDAPPQTAASSSSSSSSSRCNSSRNDREHSCSECNSSGKDSLPGSFCSKTVRSSSSTGGPGGCDALDHCRKVPLMFALGLADMLCRAVKDDYLVPAQLPAPFQRPLTAPQQRVVRRQHLLEVAMLNLAAWVQQLHRQNGGTSAVPLAAAGNRTPPTTTSSSSSSSSSSKASPASRSRSSSRLQHQQLWRVQAQHAALLTAAVSGLPADIEPGSSGA
ncbi:hypothetical protein COO60DRAFT_628601 [Scenedesmus sp. NREL 46B-D3]|nr:hypothetical protein COO60DRAFT_628601 [Scenedesmus sp. NREL 46B-D3]